MAFKNGIIDFRSDTVTQPTDAMWLAMANAKVGDDVYGEDPTINELEKLSSEMMGKEASLFVPSGTMGNLIAVLTHCQRGDEAIMGDNGHTFLHEVGGISALGGVFPQLVPNEKDGTIDIGRIKDAIREDDIHHPDTKLLIIENTQNNCGGIPISEDYFMALKDILDRNDVRLHIDGARIFNAATALNMPVSDLVSEADSIMFCLSKGLCAPVGSMLCGNSTFITRARKIRKQLGGGMRQAGILAAAGLLSLEEMATRLQEDHERARLLGEMLKEIDGIQFEKGFPQTNMVYVQVNDPIGKTANEIKNELMKKNIKVGLDGGNGFRFVTHYWINKADIDKFVNELKMIIGAV